MTTRTIIADSPPNDGRDWGCQCARCGSSAAFEDCGNCGGDGFAGHDCGEDTCCCGDPDLDNVPCGICLGRGGWMLCCSTDGWCEANPIKGREQLKPGTVEWFTLGPNPEPAK